MNIKLLFLHSGSHLEVWVELYSRYYSQGTLFSWFYSLKILFITALSLKLPTLFKPALFNIHTSVAPNHHQQHRWCQAFLTWTHQLTTAIDFWQTFCNGVQPSTESRLQAQIRDGFCPHCLHSVRDSYQYEGTNIGSIMNNVKFDTPTTYRSVLQSCFYETNVRQFRIWLSTTHLIMPSFQIIWWQTWEQNIDPKL